MFPKDAIKSEWLEKMDFWASASNVDLFYLVVAKRSVQTFETPAYPIAFRESPQTMFKVVSKHHVRESDVFRPQTINTKNTVVTQSQTNGKKLLRKMMPVSRPGRLNYRRNAADIFNNTRKIARSKKENLFDDVLNISNSHINKPILSSKARFCSSKQVEKSTRSNLQ